MQYMVDLQQLSSSWSKLLFYSSNVDFERIDISEYPLPETFLVEGKLLMFDLELFREMLSNDFWAIYDLLVAPRLSKLLTGDILSDAAFSVIDYPDILDVFDYLLFENDDPF